jgi:hypothetical protein
LRYPLSALQTFEHIHSTRVHLNSDFAQDDHRLRRPRAVMGVKKRHVEQKGFLHLRQVVLLRASEKSISPSGQQKHSRNDREDDIHQTLCSTRWKIKKLAHVRLPRFFYVNCDWKGKQLYAIELAVNERLQVHAEPCDVPNSKTAEELGNFPRRHFRLDCHCFLVKTQGPTRRYDYPQILEQMGSW